MNYKPHLFILSAFIFFLFNSLIFPSAFAVVPDSNGRCDSLRSKSITFLQAYMPAKDRRVVSRSYLEENTDYALKAFCSSPWFNTVPDSLYLNDVLPYSSIGEDVDSWRKPFYELFSPIIATCQSSSEAAVCLNREMWDMLQVVYSPNRDKPDQSPFHSMRIHMASCTGLSILLVDACRSVGVPARLAGCNWKNKEGNHSWVEVWDGGQWHHLGAFDSPLLDSTWFDVDARYADVKDAEYSIYASSYKPTGLTFYGTWCETDTTSVPAYNVTARYTCDTAAVPVPRLWIKVVNEQNERIAVPIYVVDGKSGVLLCKGTSLDDSSDLNNNFNFSLSKGREIILYKDASFTDFWYSFTFGSDDKLLVLRY